jgi:hypothetical protein
MENVIIKVVDFTEYPDVRYIHQDKDSGEQYYYDVVNPQFKSAVENGKKLVVNLDNTAGYASSFLDEAFGNLVYDFDYNDIKRHLGIISNDEPDWIDIIMNEILPSWKQKFDKKSPRKEE